MNVDCYVPRRGGKFISMHHSIWKFVFAFGLGSSAALYAQQDAVKFVQPAQSRIEGMADIRVTAPPDTSAVRFYLDGTELSDLTDDYAVATKTEPSWHTILSARWSEPGPHTLEAVATTARGRLSASLQVVFAPSAHDDLQLDGSWRFASADELPFGAMDGNIPSVVAPEFADSSWRKVAVPNSIDTVDQQWMRTSGLLGTYRRTFAVSASDLERELYLRSESCFWSCRYFINGSEIGGSVGGYLPRLIRATPLLHRGKNTIAVVVDSRASTMGIFNRLRYYYWNYSGLLQDISIQRFAPAAVTELRAQGAADGTLTLMPSTVNTTGYQVELPVTIEVEDPTQHVVLHEQRELKLPAGGGAVMPLQFKVNQPELWDLNHPKLYTVKMHTPSESFAERTGFRDIAILNGDLTLNGRPVLGLQGFDRHGDFPGLGKSQPDELADREIKLLHDKGFRIFRPAHYPTTEAELNAADKYGMLVLEEINVTGLTGEQLKSPAVIGFAHQQLERMIARDRSHPSIFAWSVGNENRTDQPGSETYVSDLIGYGKTLDSTRPFTEVSAQLRHDICYSYMDFLAVNIYAGWYTDKLADVVPELDQLATYAGNKPMVITEYGAEAVVGRPGTGKGTEYFQALTVDVHNRLLRNRPHFIGKMYWTSTEFVVGPGWSGGNPDPIPPFHTKALLTYDRQPKLAWRVMFSPIEMDESDAIEVGSSLPIEKTIHVSLHNREGRLIKGQFIVTPPPGSTASITEQPFSLLPNDSAELTFQLKIDETKTGHNNYGMVRAVVDDQTEAMPVLLQIKKTCPTCKP
jgi:Glycosyl hydrolases family 2, TIM barrel domain/Glycosyl hydrolases family 2, sugar binding domain/Glycosyl hydrolases family 2